MPFLLSLDESTDLEMGSIGAADVEFIELLTAFLMLGMMGTLPLVSRGLKLLLGIVWAMVMGLPLTKELVVVLEPDVGIIIGCNKGGWE